MAIGGRRSLTPPHLNVLNLASVVPLLNVDKQSNPHERPLLHEPVRALTGVQETLQLLPPNQYALHRKGVKASRHQGNQPQAYTQRRHKATRQTTSARQDIQIEAHGSNAMLSPAFNILQLRTIQSIRSVACKRLKARDIAIATAIANKQESRRPSSIPLY